MLYAALSVVWRYVYYEEPCDIMDKKALRQRESTCSRAAAAAKSLAGTRRPAAPPPLLATALSSISKTFASRIARVPA